MNELNESSNTWTASAMPLLSSSITFPSASPTCMPYSCPTCTVSSTQQGITWSFVLGTALAVLSALFIGISYILTKRGLIRYAAKCSTSSFRLPIFPQPKKSIAGNAKHTSHTQPSVDIPNDSHARVSSAPIYPTMGTKAELPTTTIEIVDHGPSQMSSERLLHVPEQEPPAQQGQVHVKNPVEIAGASQGRVGYVTDPVWCSGMLLSMLSYSYN